MPDPITDRASQILASKQESFIPFEQLYDALAREGLMAWIEPRDLLKLLLDDERFEIVEGLEEVILLEDGETGNEMEGINMLGGPWVMLRERNISTLEVMSDLLTYLHQLNQSLEQVWKHLINDPETEGEIINMLLLGDILERRVRETLKQVIEENLGGGETAHSRDGICSPTDLGQ